jgi:hypothetical protein
MKNNYYLLASEFVGKTTNEEFIQVLDCLVSNINADLLMIVFNYIEIKYPTEYTMYMIDNDGNEIELGTCYNLEIREY